MHPLHTRCALTDDTLVHPLYGYGKMEFRLLLEPPYPVQGRVCDGCGEPTLGPRWLSLRASPEGIARFASDFWRQQLRAAGVGSGVQVPYSHLDGKAVDLHVACFKELIRTP